jgi:hypothetical protein
MRRLPYLAGFRSNVLDRYRLRRIQQVKCCGKTKGAMIIRRMLMLVVGREGATASRVLAELG